MVLRQFSGNNAIWCYASSIFESAGNQGPLVLLLVFDGVK